LAADELHGGQGSQEEHRGDAEGMHRQPPDREDRVVAGRGGGCGLGHGLFSALVEGGLGGSCFQKDILNLVYLCGHYGLYDVAAYWQSVLELNSWQQHRIARLVVQRLFGTVTGKRLAILGFAFKADTNDTREAPAIRICQDLLEEGAQLAALSQQVRQQSSSVSRC
jgi:UDP-N-acetyl-D-mannosaminuronate dehydrogenase